MQASVEVGRLIAFDLIRNAPEQVLNVAILAFSNVITDLISLAITYVHLTKISNSLKHRKTISAIFYVAQDIIIAGILFVISQLISSYLYPRALINPPADFNPFSIDAALMPYAFMQSVTDGVVNYYPFVFPGQLFITGTVFAPTVIAMTLILLITLILIILKVIGRLQFYFLKDDALLDLLAPAALPEVGDALQNRTKRCIRFSVNSVYIIILSVMGSLIFYLISRIFSLS